MKTVLDTEDIMTSFTGNGNSFLCGTSIQIDQPLAKYVITTSNMNVIKEHAFIGRETGTNKFLDTELYPVLIKPFNLLKPFGVQYCPLLIRKGILNFHQTQNMSTYPATFTIIPLLRDVVESIEYADSIVGGFVHYAWKYLEKYTELWYNEGVLSGLSYDIDMIAHNILLKGQSLNAFDTNPNAFIQHIFEEFEPSVPYDFRKDTLTQLSCWSGILHPHDIYKMFQFDTVEIDEIASNDTLIEYYLNKSDVVIYADSSFTKDAYKVYETLQTCPYTDVYLEYILQDSVQALSDRSIVSNYYYNYISKQPINDPWCAQIVVDVLCDMYDGLGYNDLAQPALDLEDPPRKIEIIVRDYHGLIVIPSGGRLLTIVYDLILNSTLSRSLSSE